MTATITQALRQIGGMTLLAISGGRYAVVGDDTVDLPVSHGYRVRVIYERGRDTYTVQRVLRRGLREWVKSEVHDVYSEQLSDAAYRQSLLQG